MRKKCEHLCLWRCLTLPVHGPGRSSRIPTCCRDKQIDFKPSGRGGSKKCQLVNVKSRQKERKRERERAREGIAAFSFPVTIEKRLRSVASALSSYSAPKSGLKECEMCVCRCVWGVASHAARMCARARACVCVWLNSSVSILPRVLHHFSTSKSHQRNLAWGKFIDPPSYCPKGEQFRNTRPSVWNYPTSTFELNILWKKKIF